MDGQAGRSAMADQGKHSGRTVADCMCDGTPHVLQPLGERVTPTARHEQLKSHVMPPTARVACAPGSSEVAPRGVRPIKSRPPSDVEIALHNRRRCHVPPRRKSLAIGTARREGRLGGRCGAVDGCMERPFSAENAAVASTNAFGRALYLACLWRAIGFALWATPPTQSRLLETAPI